MDVNGMGLYTLNWKDFFGKQQAFLIAIYFSSSIAGFLDNLVVNTMIMPFFSNINLTQFYHSFNDACFGCQPCFKHIF